MEIIKKELRYMFSNIWQYYSFSWSLIYIKSTMMKGWCKSTFVVVYFKLDLRFESLFRLTPQGLIQYTFLLRCSSSRINCGPLFYFQYAACVCFWLFLIDDLSTIWSQYHKLFIIIGISILFCYKSITNHQQSACKF